MRFACLDELAEAAIGLGSGRRAAIARSADTLVLRSGLLAHERGLADPVFIGDREATLRAADAAGLDISPFPLIPVADDREAVARAVQLFREGGAAFIMKGLVSTNVLLRGVLDKERGIPPKGVLSHVTVFSLPGRDRLTLLTDAGVNIRPSLQRKADILKNAVETARRLGISRPRAALLAAVEKVNHPAMPATLDAALLVRMAENGDFGDILAAGPLALDLAVSPEAAARKGVDNPVAGRADILLAPDIESGNILYKALNSIVGLDMASVVVGSGAPIVTPSRGDGELSRFYSMALAAWLSAQPGEKEN